MYATLIYIPKSKRDTYLKLLLGVYDRCLKWAYEDAWDSNDPFPHIPKFRQELVSSSRYPVDEDSLRVRYLIWKILFKKVRKAQMPLPKAKKIVPVIVSTWNRRKGRIDEMTRKLDEMHFDFAKGTPKQKLVLREIKKLALSVYFAKKHCFPSKPIPTGQGYTKIQVHMNNLGREFVMKEVLYKLCTTYVIINPARALPLVPGAIELNDEDSEEDATLARRGIAAWQKKAVLITKEIEKKRNKLALFANSAELNRIRTDTRLNHTQRSTARGTPAEKRVISRGKTKAAESAQKRSKVR